MTKKFKIKGMHCTSCVLDIDGTLEDLPGVEKAATSYAREETEISFDEKQISLPKIASELKKLGYQLEI